MAQKKKRGSKPIKKDPEKIKKQEQKEKRTSIIMISVFAAIIIASIVLIFVFGVPSSGNGNTSTQTAEAPSQTVSENVYSEEPSEISDVSFVDIDENKTYTAEIKVKDYGTITVELDPKSAPITVKNFVSLVQSGFYDGLTFTGRRSKRRRHRRCGPHHKRRVCTKWRKQSHISQEGRYFHGKKQYFYGQRKLSVLYRSVRRSCIIA